MTEEQRRRWLEPAHFEVVELAVHPSRQGNGTGTALLEDVLAGLPHERAVLSARREDARVLDFYASRGWETIVESLRFSAGRPPFVVLGRELG
jgi:GNAT superfamily N-acetyltransferase